MSGIRGRGGVVIPVPASRPSEGGLLIVLSAAAVAALAFVAVVLIIGAVR